MIVISTEYASDCATMISEQTRTSGRRFPVVYLQFKICLLKNELIVTNLITLVNERVVESMKESLFTLGGVLNAFFGVLNN